MTTSSIDVREGDAAVRLARHLNAPRKRPVVVITVPAGRQSSYIDVEQVTDEVGDLAEVYVLHPGEESFAFAREMADHTQVYGGAGRVYPVGTAWVADLRRSPLRLAFDEQQGRAATRALISDALAMANAAGLFERPSTAATRVTGEVKGFAAGLAVVRTSAGPASIPQELVVPGVPLERVLRKGQRLTGVLDDGKRLDIREMLVPAELALAEYAVGAVVLARVHDVQADHAVLDLHPDRVVTVERAQVTSNELDDLTTLLTVGEVVRARLVAGAPDWELALYDVDDDEPVSPACALTLDGPPWLVEEDAAAFPEQPPAPTSVAVAPPPTPAAEPTPVPTPPVVEPAPHPRSPIATPMHLDRKRRAAGAVPSPRRDAAPPAKAPSATQTEATLRKQLEGTRAHVAHLEAERKTFLQQQDLQAKHANEARRRIERLEGELLEMKRKLRKTRTKEVAEQVERASDWFVEPEEQFRYDVRHSWVRRVPAGEKHALPLPDYDIGPDFLRSLDELQGVDRQKVADVVMEVVTGYAARLAGRAPHPLRSGMGGDDPAVQRDRDGATSWRVALQVNTPAARRLHYWVQPGGRVELSRVVSHDDYRP